jgi:predicted PurR-regulated permease PerM
MKPSVSAAKKSSDLAFLKSTLIIGLAIGALYYARELLIPFALALLLSFLLTPPVAWLEKLRLGRIPTVLIVLTLAFSILGIGLWVGMTQLADIAANAPQYQRNLHRKIAATRTPAGSALSKAIMSVEQLSGELEDAASAGIPANVPKAGTRPDGRSKTPQPVEVVKPRGIFAGSASQVGSSLLRLLGLAVTVLIFALFMLVQRGDLRNRFLQLVGTGNLTLMTTALDEAAHGISRYLLTQLIINTAFGVLVGLGLFLIGVPNAPFWGTLGMVLRFVPYVGSFIAGLCPFVLSIAVFQGWTKPLITLGLFASIELVISTAIEPWLYGAHTGISSLAILVSAAFWTLLWGPIGLILSTPLTVCLLVLGRYVPSLQFLNVALGEKVELSTSARYYQRLLAMDDDDAQHIAEDYLKNNTIVDLFDTVLVPALALAEADRHQDVLDAEREQFVYATTRQLIEDLAEDVEDAQVGSNPTSNAVLVSIPARDEADELVTVMVEHALRLAGHRAAAIPLGTRAEMFQALQEQKHDTLLISAVPPFAVMQARTLCRRARRRFPNRKIVLGLWTSTDELEALRGRPGLECFDAIITKISQVEAQLGLTLEPGLQQQD